MFQIHLCEFRFHHLASEVKYKSVELGKIDLVEPNDPFMINLGSDHTYEDEESNKKYYHLREIR